MSASEETKMILEMLREGRITADEAANLLEAMNSTVRAETEAKEAGRSMRDNAEEARQGAKRAVREAKAQIKEELRQVRQQSREAMRELREESKHSFHFHCDEDHDDEDCEENEAEHAHDRHGCSSGCSSGSSSGLERLSALIGSVASGLGGVAHTWNETVEGELPDTPVTRIVIRGVNGWIRVEPGEQVGPKWELRVEKSVRATTEKAAELAAQDLYSVQTSGESLVIEAKKVFGQNRTVNFLLLLPLDRKYVLDIGSTNGSIGIGKLHIDVAKVTTTNGKVNIDADGEEFVLGSTNGRIEMTGCARLVSCRTVNGKVAIDCERPREGSIEVSTVNGSVTIQLGSGSGSGSGRALELGIRFRGETLAGTVKSHLVSGKIISDERRRVGRKLVVQRTVPSGQMLDIRAKTVNGTITIEEV